MLNGTEDWLGLRGKVCVVTGAGGGIGQATAELFCRQGARVACLDIDVEACVENAHTLDPSGDFVAGLECDVTDPASIESAREALISKWGQCDILVNNAGILRAGDLRDISLVDWNKTIQVNLNGYLLCAQRFGAVMIEQGQGAIVHVASIAATQPQPHSGAYSASKAAIAMMSQQLAFEWGPLGVRSNIVSPGLIRTPLSESFYQTPGIVKRREAVVPSGRIGAPEDIANAVIFLASPRASYVNGQALIVDGGFTCTLMSHVPRPGFD